MKVFDYECKQGHVTEELFEQPPEYITCPKCAKRATKVSVYALHGQNLPTPRFYD